MPGNLRCGVSTVLFRADHTMRLRAGCWPFARPRSAAKSSVAGGTHFTGPSEELNTGQIGHWGRKEQPCVLDMTHGIRFPKYRRRFSHFDNERVSTLKQWPRA